MMGIVAKASTRIVALIIGTWYVWSTAYLVVTHPDMNASEWIGYMSSVIAQFAFGVGLVMIGLGAKVLRLLEKV
jgi:hypothetical protein